MQINTIDTYIIVLYEEKKIENVGKFYINISISRVQALYEKFKKNSALNYQLSKNSFFNKG